MDRQHTHLQTCKNLQHTLEGGGEGERKKGNERVGGEGVEEKIEGRQMREESDRERWEEV